MKTVFDARFAGTSALAVIAAALALAGCNPSDNQGRDQAAYQLPALPATLPLAPGGTTTPAYAPAAALLPASSRIGTARVADPRDDYAYADDARGFADAVGDAPPDYGFYYEDVEPWAWQGYDNSREFVEPLGSGYRYYYYRPGADTPYFVRDPDYGYGYDNGQLSVVYGSDGRIVPYDEYGPRLDYASRYYARGRALYTASRQRRPVIAANWAARQEAIVDTRRWAEARAAQPAWQQYHQRTEPQQARHWDEEQARRRADTVRFTAWQGNDFRTPPPPRAIPQAWTRASWARDDHRFAPPAAGFNGDAAARLQAAQKERAAIAAQARQPQPRPQDLQAQPGTQPGANLQEQPPHPQPQAVTGRGEPQHVRFGPGDSRLRGADMAAHQQAERALQAQRQQQEAAQRQQAAAQQAAGRQQQDRAAASARQAQLQVQQRDAAQARERVQGQVRAQQAAQQQAQARQRGEAQAQAQRAQAEQRQAQLHAGQQAQAQQRQAAQAQQRAQVQAQQRVQAQARAQQRQAQQRAEQSQAQAQQRVLAQAQAQQRQAVQAQQRAQMQAHQRPPAPPPQPRPAPVARPQPSAPAAAHPNPGDHKHEPH